MIFKAEWLSTSCEDRFIIVDETTGEILDDANGYGYRSKVNAKKAWNYKNYKQKQKGKQ